MTLPLCIETDWQPIYFHFIRNPQLDSLDSVFMFLFGRGGVGIIQVAAVCSMVPYCTYSFDGKQQFLKTITIG